MNYLSDPKVDSVDDRCEWADSHILFIFTHVLNPVINKGAPIFLMTKEMRQDVRKPLNAKTNSTQARY